MGGICTHDMHTKFPEDRFRHLRDIKVIISTVSEGVVLVLLMEGIYEECLSDSIRWHGTHTNFHDVASGIKRILILLDQ
jgi:hypothetical protein